VGLGVVGSNPATPTIYLSEVIAEFTTTETRRLLTIGAGQHGASNRSLMARGGMSDGVRDRLKQATAEKGSPPRQHSPAPAVSRREQDPAGRRPSTRRQTHPLICLSWDRFAGAEPVNRDSRSMWSGPVNRGRAPRRSPLCIAPRLVAGQARAEVGAQARDSGRELAGLYADERQARCSSRLTSAELPQSEPVAVTVAPRSGACSGASWAVRARRAWV
jgi:hypothetical protein